MVSTSNLTKDITHNWTYKIWVYRVLSYMWIKNNVRNKPNIPHVIMNERSWKKREISINYKIQLQCHIITLVKSSVINYDYPSGPLGLCLGRNVGQGKWYNRVRIVETRNPWVNHFVSSTKFQTSTPYFLI